MFVFRFVPLVCGVLVVLVDWIFKVDLSVCLFFCLPRSVCLSLFMFFPLSNVSIAFFLRFLFFSLVCGFVHCGKEERIYYALFTLIWYQHWFYVGLHSFTFVHPSGNCLFPLAKLEKIALGKKFAGEEFFFDQQLASHTQECIWYDYLISRTIMRRSD